MIQTACLSAEDRYKALCQEEWWTLEEFCCLVVGILPEAFHGVCAKQEEYFNLQNVNRAITANKLFRLFLKDAIDIWRRDGFLDTKTVSMSAWRFIKWAATKNLPLERCFMDAIPLYLLEIYLEFTDEHAPLHTKPKSSQPYHRALYLKVAKRLIDMCPRRLTRDEIISHPTMQNVLRQIRALGGNYKKRTITDSWLPMLEKRGKGRPKKFENPKSKNELNTVSISL